MIGRRPQPRIPAWRALAALAAVVLALAAFAGRWQANAGPAVVSFAAGLDGAQAGVESDAVGSASVTIDEELGLLSWTLTWSGFASAVTAIHFHGPAAPGEDAFVTVELSNISGLAPPSAGSTSIDEIQQAELLADLWYINIHSEDAPLGEIRGQVIREAGPAPTPTFPPCDDPDSDAGAKLALIGLGTPDHNVTRQGQVCPGESETWSFATLAFDLEQFIGIRVIEKSPAISISVLTPDLGEGFLEAGEVLEASHVVHPAEYTITITGAGKTLAGYRLQVCRSINNPCPFSEDVTPKLPGGDANCSGDVTSLDALLVLQLIADLIDAVTCPNAADANGNGTIDAIDAALILQFTAGLLS